MHIGSPCGRAADAKVCWSSLAFYFLFSSLMQLTCSCVCVSFLSVLPQIEVSVGGHLVLDAKMAKLRDVWEATSFQLERLQCNPACVAEEEAGMARRRSPPLRLTYTPTAPKHAVPAPSADAPRVCVVREEGSNGDREMVVALALAGFQASVSWRREFAELRWGHVSRHSYVSCDRF